MEESLIVEFDQVNKRLGGFRLEDVTFGFPRGYIMGLVGANGAGKTSLIHMILGIYAPDSGTVRVLGNDYDTKEAWIKERLGFVLQEDLFYTGQSLMGNGDFFGRKYSNFHREQLMRYIDLFGLDGKKKYGRLSKGEKLKFQLAFALSHEPELLILDEAAGSFDPEFRTEFQRIIAEFIEDGKRSVILSTHVFDEIDRMADYILLMDNGKIILYKDRERIAQEYRFVSGESYKINRISRDRIVYAEGNKEQTKALVRHSRYHDYDKELKVTEVTMSDFIYYLMAGLKTDGKGGCL